MKIENIDKAIQLRDEIKDLEHFINRVLNIDEVSIKHISCGLVKYTETKYTLFGSRYFGLGSHKQEVNIPNTLLNDIKSISELRLKHLKDELNAL